MVGSLGVRKGKILLLMAVHMGAILFVLLFFPLHVYGPLSDYFYVSCAIIQSAVLFYGVDLFELGTRFVYLCNLVLHFLIALLLGSAIFLAGTKEIWFHDGTCLLTGGTTTTLFFEFQLQNLMIAMPISLLWIGVRRAEIAVKLVWRRRNLCKTP